MNPSSPTGKGNKSLGRGLAALFGELGAYEDDRTPKSAKISQNQPKSAKIS